MAPSVLADKSVEFAVKILRLRDYLAKEKREYIISKQIVRSATSIGANICEANYGQSRADFISKMHIALKETAETEYWIVLLKQVPYITPAQAEALLADCLSLKRMLISTLNTTKSYGEK